MNFSLIVAAAGDGTRMGSHLPKALVPIAGSTLIEKATSSLAKICNEAVVVVKRASVVHFEDVFTRLNGLAVRYTYQETPKGTADAVHKGLQQAENDWSIVVWADQAGAFFVDSELLLRPTNDSTIDMVVPVVWKRDPYAYFRLDTKMYIKQFCETRRGAPRVSKGWSDCGIFIVRTSRVRNTLGDLLSEEVGDQNFLSLFPKFNDYGIRLETLRLTDERLTLGANTTDEVARVEQEIISAGDGRDGGH